MSGIITDNVGRSSGLVKSAGGGGGKLLQVRETTDDDVISTNSTSPTATGLLQAITPTAASSKIIVTCWSGSWSSQNNGWSFVYFDVAGGGYAVVPPIGAASGSRMRCHAFTQQPYTNQMFFSILHAPSYTLGQEITYQLYIEVDSATYYVWLGRSNTDTDDDKFGRSPTGIRVEEIAA